MFQIGAEKSSTIYLNKPRNEEKIAYFLSPTHSRRIKMAIDGKKKRK
jgi:hypothetical protein